jgi:hypothetical protein
MELFDESFFDYSSKGFMMQLEIDGLNMYACINTEMYYDGGLAETGQYYIYLLHPKHGSCIFKIEQDLNGLWHSNDISFLEDALINEIGAEISRRKI